MRSTLDDLYDGYKVKALLLSRARNGQEKVIAAHLMKDPTCLWHVFIVRSWHDASFYVRRAAVS